MTVPTDAQRSEDGFYWWDGAAWQTVPEDERTRGSRGQIEMGGHRGAAAQSGASSVGNDDSVRNDGVGGAGAGQAADATAATEPLIPEQFPYLLDIESNPTIHNFLMTPAEAYVVSVGGFQPDQADERMPPILVAITTAQQTGMTAWTNQIAMMSLAQAGVTDGVSAQVIACFNDWNNAAAAVLEAGYSCTQYVCIYTEATRPDLFLSSQMAQQQLPSVAGNLQGVGQAMQAHANRLLELHENLIGRGFY